MSGLAHLPLAFGSIRWAVTASIILPPSYPTQGLSEPASQRQGIRPPCHLWQALLAPGVWGNTSPLMAALLGCSTLAQVIWGNPASIKVAGLVLTSTPPMCGCSKASGCVQIWGLPQNPAPAQDQISRITLLPPQHQRFGKTHSIFLLQLYALDCEGSLHTGSKLTRTLSPCGESGVALRI